MPLAAFMKDICISFLVDGIFDARPQYHSDTLSLARTKCSLINVWWFEDAARQSGKALYALAAMLIGRGNGAPVVIQKAIKLYGESIAELRTDLPNSEYKNSVRTLLLMTLLCMYEVSLLSLYFNIRGLR
jgi:hypothetical protein